MLKSEMKILKEKITKIHVTRTNLIVHIKVAALPWTQPRTNGCVLRAKSNTKCMIPVSTNNIKII